MTWQQQQLLAEEYAAPASPAAHSAERYRERSPAHGSRRMAMGAGPQPSQHLRAAAHTAHGSRLDEYEAGEAAGPQPTSHAAFLKQLGGGPRPKQEQQDECDAAAWPAPGEVPHGKQAMAKEAAASAAAAALAAVQGLKPFCTVAPPRSAKSAAAAGAALAARRGASPMAPQQQQLLHSHQASNTSSPQAAGMHKGGQLAPARSGSGHLQLPSVEETQAAVMAALGAGPAAPPSRSSSLNSSSNYYAEDLPQQDSGSFWRTGGAERHDGAAAAVGFEGREKDSRDRELELAREGSGSQQGGCEAAAGSSGPRFGSSSLFSNVIGQLRKQATTTRSDSGGDAEGGRWRWWLEG